MYWRHDGDEVVARHSNNIIIKCASGVALCIQAIGPKAVVNSEAIADIMVAVPGFPSRHLEFLKADESSSMAWFRAKRNGGR